MRYTRLIIGICLVLLALWVLIGEQMAGASADAVVNARLSTMRAPIAGDVEMQNVPIGRAVRQGEELSAISDPLADTVRRSDLAMERALALADVDHVQAQIAATQAGIAGLDGRVATFRAERVAEITTRLDHAQARLKLLEDAGTATAAAADAKPAETGGKAGRASLALLDSGATAGDPLLPGLERDYAQERVDVLQIELASAQKGVFLGDGYNDAPFAEQRQIQLAGVKQGLETDLGAARARLAAVEARLSEADLMVNKLSSAVMTSTVNGQVWDLLASDGERVQRGQDVLRLVDCDSAIVTASVTEPIYDALRVGDPAKFRLNGKGESYGGTVVRLAGAGALTLYQNLAVAPSEKHLQRYDVAILVPALRDDAELRCGIGRTGRVFFKARPLDRLRNLLP